MPTEKPKMVRMAGSERVGERDRLPTTSPLQVLVFRQSKLLPSSC